MKDEATDLERVCDVLQDESVETCDVFDNAIERGQSARYDRPLWHRLR